MDESMIEELVFSSVAEEYTLKQPKATSREMKKISETLLANENLDVSMDTVWNELTMKLNEIGPAVRSAKEWRKVWPNYKYQNKKRYISTRFKDGDEDSGSACSATTAGETVAWKDAFESFLAKRCKI
ncbi:hypothetical protein Bhyg_16491 [Pseudolycoriella hygida]|uniref:Regulatory protein zeste n=1 Tax=Pseudolycoriella hygida TaxID=35572 RepID=A0A9Q0MI64_9DIPT|nr:hypothetical protein Bhyg_16491 [Pseudolycoriella hygida]